MNLREFARAGHWPTLACAFLYFDVSFMVWVILGALANSIAADLQLSISESGLMVATPLLGGALLRLPFGWLADRWGARRTGMLGLLLTLVPLAIGWLWAPSPLRLLLVGLMLGVAGASFAVALPLAGRWYPPRLQGLVLGITGAGNSGTAVATFFGPQLAEQVGWQAVMGLAALPVLATLAVFVAFARESPYQPPPRPGRDYLKVLGQRDAWSFCLLYSVTFGGFVGLASFLGIFFHEQYHLDRVSAGTIAAGCVLAGSLLRPVGGCLADRFGGIRVLGVLYPGVALMLALLGLVPSLLAAALALVCALGWLGMGNGAVFQLVPQRFPRDLGVITGTVGAVGGIGGFFLPVLLGGLRQLTGSFTPGFAVFALCNLGCLALLARLAVRGSTCGSLCGTASSAPLPSAAQTPLPDTELAPLGKPSWARADVGGGP